MIKRIWEDHQMKIVIGIGIAIIVFGVWWSYR